MDTSNRNHIEKKQVNEMANHKVLADEKSINLNTLWKWLIAQSFHPLYNTAVLCQKEASYKLPKSEKVIFLDWT